MTETVFTFAHDSRFAPLLLLGGVTSGRSRVVVDDTHVRASFGPWRLETPRANVTAATVTGPYRWFRSVGLRISMADRGVTFGTTAGPGTCVQLREPVSLRVGKVTLPLKHPGMTFTVTDPAALATLLATPAAPSAPSGEASG